MSFVQVVDKDWCARVARDMAEAACDMILPVPSQSDLDEFIRQNPGVIQQAPPAVPGTRPMSWGRYTVFVVLLVAGTILARRPIRSSAPPITRLPPIPRPVDPIVRQTRWRTLSQTLRRATRVLARNVDLNPRRQIIEYAMELALKAWRSPRPGMDRIAVQMAFEELFWQCLMDASLRNTLPQEPQSPRVKRMAATRPGRRRPGPKPT